MSDDDMIRRGDAIAKCRAMADEAKSYGMPQMAMGGYASAEAIAAIPAADARAEALKEAVKACKAVADELREDNDAEAVGALECALRLTALIPETKP